MKLEKEKKIKMKSKKIARIFIRVARFITIGAVPRLVKMDRKKITEASNFASKKIEITCQQKSENEMK